MNCSMVADQRVFIGTKDRRIFIFNKYNLEQEAIIEVPETVHCMCLLKEMQQVAVGMTDGHVWILDADKPEQAARVPIKAQFRETGGIWSIAGCNNDQELALGTISGVHIVFLDAFSMRRVDEHYLKDKNIWNVNEYDTNKLVVTCWEDANVYLVDRTDPDAVIKKPNFIADPDKKNINVTDLLPLPNYHPKEAPFFLKRGKNSIQLLDISQKKLYMLYKEPNNQWGYNKVAVVDKGFGRFQLLFIIAESRTD